MHIYYYKDLGTWYYVYLKREYNLWLGISKVIVMSGNLEWFLHKLEMNGVEVIKHGVLVIK